MAASSSLPLVPPLVLKSIIVPESDKIVSAYATQIVDLLSQFILLMSLESYGSCFYDALSAIHIISVQFNDMIRLGIDRTKLTDEEVSGLYKLSPSIMAKILKRFSHSSIGILQIMIKGELMHTHNIETIFREDNFTTALIRGYIKEIFQNYFIKLVRKELEKLQKNKCDTTKVAQNIINILYKDRPNTPKEIENLCVIIERYVMERFPHNKEIGFRHAIYNMLFLRFICPLMISNHQILGVTKDHLIENCLNNGKMVAQYIINLMSNTKDIKTRNKVDAYINSFCTAHIALNKKRIALTSKLSSKSTYTLPHMADISKIGIKLSPRVQIETTQLKAFLSIIKICIPYMGKHLIDASLSSNWNDFVKVLEETMVILNKLPPIMLNEIMENAFNSRYTFDLYCNDYGSSSSAYCVSPGKMIMKTNSDGVYSKPLTPR